MLVLSGVAWQGLSIDARPTGRTLYQLVFLARVARSLLRNVLRGRLDLGAEQ